MITPDNPLFDKLMAAFADDPEAERFKEMLANARRHPAQPVCCTEQCVEQTVAERFERAFDRLIDKLDVGKIKAVK